MKIIEGFEPVKSVLSRQASKQGFESDDKEQAVRQIINDVREKGDTALLEYTEKFDGVRRPFASLPFRPANRSDGCG